MTSWIAAVLLCLSIAPVPAPEKLRVSLLDGSTLKVEVLEVTGDKAKLKIHVLGGHAVVKRSLEDFTPRSIFEMELQAANPSDFDGHFAMAKRAGELGMVASAGKQARAAIAAAASAPDLPQKEQAVRAWAADALESLIQKAVAAGDDKEAEDLLDILVSRLADQRNETQLAALAQQVANLEKQKAMAKEAERTAKLDAKRNAELERRVDPIRKRVEAGDKHFQRAIAISEKTSQSAHSCEEAIHAYKAAWSLTKDLAVDFDEDDEVQRRVVDFGERLHQKAIRAALHAASVLTTQSNYHGAKEWVEKVLNFDPDHADALQMLETIQQAETDAANWKWGWRRKRPKTTYS
jgi:tetratricopeptide (TPR) repeat protein